VLDNAAPPTALYTLSLHDALPIFPSSASISSYPTTPGSAMSSSKPMNVPDWPTMNLSPRRNGSSTFSFRRPRKRRRSGPVDKGRSEEHTSELQSRENLVCRLLLEK